MDKTIPEAVLLPCPMCGSDAALNTCRTTESEFIRLNGRDTGYGVNCVTCGLNNRGFAYGYATPAEAITAWNRRTLTAAQQPDHIVDATKMVAQQQGQADDEAAAYEQAHRAGESHGRIMAALEQPMQQGGGEVVAWHIQHEDGLVALRKRDSVDSHMREQAAADGVRIRPLVFGDKEAAAMALIRKCKDALAEELAAWDINPPLAHVNDAHDACIAFLAGDTTPPSAPVGVEE